MADNPLVPEELTTAGLPTSRRGFDRKAVAALVEEAARRWTELRDHHDAVVAEIERRGGIENLGRDLREIGERVTTILGEAQQAADELRSHAMEEAGGRLDEMADHTDGLLREAQQTAFVLRSDAWESGTELLSQVHATAEAMIERTEADALIIRAQAEQDAHRHLTDARKEVADTTRGARFEAERLVGEAKKRADELISEATLSGSGAMGQEAEVRTPGWGVKVIGSESRRLGRDPAVEIDPHHPAYGDVLAAEVSTLREQEVMPEIPEPPPDDSGGMSSGEIMVEDVPVLAPQPEPERPVEPERPEPETEYRPETEADPHSDRMVGKEAEPVAEVEPEAAAAPDEVDGLFDRLRRTDETPAVPVDPERFPVPEPQPVEPEPASEFSAPPPSIASGPDAVEVRDRMLLPVLNEYVREARRQLIEVQNQALDEIRTLRRGTAWQPDSDLVTGAMRDAVAPLATAAVEAGGRGAAELGAAPAPGTVSEARALSLIEDMAQAMTAEATNAAAAEDPRSEVARVFRSWRNDEIERWVRTAGYAGYHDGLVAGLAGAGFAEIVGIRHGRLCTECPAAAGIIWDPAGPPPDPYRSPPARLDCTCAVEPHV